jgi:hypothetical protein
MDGLVDTHVYKKVAAAKLTKEQNSIRVWRLWSYMGRVEDGQAKIDGAWQILMSTCFWRFPLAPKECLHETNPIMKFILSFHLYKEHPKQSLYVIWTTILVCTVPEIRIGLSTWIRTPTGFTTFLLVMHLHASFKLFLVSYPLQLYRDGLLTVIKCNSLNMQYVYIIMCHITFLIHYKSL